MRYYLHIPFCRQRCTYCRFALDPRPSEAKIVKYLAHLIKEATEAVNTYDTDGSDFPIETLYFGGGTPSILNTKKLQILLSVFPHAFRDPNIEITIECNPEDITREYAEDLKSLGFTRISLGVQTMSDIGLRSIGRSSSESIYRALDSLRDAGHTNINIDVILGLPDMEEG